MKLALYPTRHLLSPGGSTPSPPHRLPSTSRRDDGETTLELVARHRETTLGRSASEAEALALFGE
jgi:hypothetical protein